MSDSQNSAEDHTAPTDATESDLVERANDALADADAARADVDQAAAEAAGAAEAGAADAATEAADSAEAAADAATVAADDAAGAADEASTAASSAIAETAADSAQAAADDARDAAADARDEANAAEIHSDDDRRAASAAAAAMADDDDTPWYDRPEVAAATATLPPEVQDATTPLAPPAAAPIVEPVAEPVAPVAPAVAQPIFVQAPEPPRKRGNRGFSGVVALLAAIIFGVVYLAARLFFGPEPVAMDEIGNAALAALTSWTLWIPVAAFFLAFWLLGAFLNTAKWGYWVVFGLLVGVAALAGHALGEIMQLNIFKVTPSQAADVANSAIFSLGGFIAFILGRELPIWFGGWIARRGRTVIAANAEAQEEYQRTLEAGPQVLAQ